VGTPGVGGGMWGGGTCPGGGRGRAPIARTRNGGAGAGGDASYATGRAVTLIPAEGGGKEAATVATDVAVGQIVPQLRFRCGTAVSGRQRQRQRRRRQWRRWRKQKRCTAAAFDNCSCGQQRTTATAAATLADGSGGGVVRLQRQRRRPVAVARRSTPRSSEAASYGCDGNSGGPWRWRDAPCRAQRRRPVAVARRSTPGSSGAASNGCNGNGGGLWRWRDAPRHARAGRADRGQLAAVS